MAGQALGCDSAAAASSWIATKLSVAITDSDAWEARDGRLFRAQLSRGARDHSQLVVAAASISRRPRQPWVTRIRDAALTSAVRPKSKARIVRSPLAPLKSLENADDDTDKGREIEAADTRLWCACETELLLPSTGEPRKLDHGLLATRLLSERRLLCPRLDGTPAGGGMSADAL